MPRSKPPRRPAQRSPTRKRPDIAARNRVLASLAEILRNLGLLLFGAPLVEPLINPGDAFDQTAGLIAMAAGLAMLSVSLTIDYLRKEP